MANKRIDYVIGFNADTSKLSSALKQLESQLNNIAIGKNTPAGTLTTQIQQASKAALELNSYLNKSINVDTGKLDLSAFSKALALGKTDLQTLRTNLVQIGPAGQEAFASLARAIGQAEMPLRRSNELLDKLWVTMKNTLRWQVTSGLLTGIATAFGDAVRYAQDLNESLNNIRIVTGKSTEEMAQFAKQANRAAKELNTTTTKYTDASLIYYQQGLDDKSVKARTDVTAKFANVSRESLTTSSEYLTAIWNNFAKGSENLEYFADVIVALGAATASSSQEIATGLNKFAATAETVGLSYEYATAALATVTATTRQSADVVGTAFKTLFSRIQDLELGKTLDDGTTLGKYSQALDAVGVSIKDSNGELRDMDAILDDVGEKWQNLNKDEQVALAQAVGGVRQYAQFIALMDNWDFMKENLETAKNATGELQNQADIFAESWEAARKNVKASAEGIYDSLIKDDFWIDLTNGFAGFLKIIENAIDSVGGLRGVLLGLAVVLQKQFGERFREGLRETAYQLSYLIGGGQKQRREAVSLKGAAGDALKGSVYGDTNIKVQTKITQDIIGFQTKIDSIYDKLTDDQKRSLDLQIALVENTQKLALEQNRVAIATKQTAENYADTVMDNIVEREDFDPSQYRLSAARLERERRTRAREGTPQLTDRDIETAAAAEFKNFHNQDSRNLLGQYVTQIRETASMGRLVANLRNKENSYSRKELLSIWDSLGVDDGYGGVNEEQSDKELRQEIINRLQAQSAERAADAQNRLNYIRQVFQFDGRDDEDQSRFNAFLEELRNRARNAGAEEFQSLLQGLYAGKVGEGVNPESPKPDWADRLTDITDAATKAGFAYSSFVGVVNSLQDDSLTPLEKLQSVIFGLGSGLPAAVSGFKALTNIFKAGGLVGKGILGLGAAGSAGVAIAGIVAVVAVIKTIADLVLTTKERTEELNKQQEFLKNNLEQVKSEYNEIKSSIESIESAQENLNAAIKGTTEWREAVASVNEEVLKLLESYPELASEVENANGVLTLSEAGKQKLLDKQLQELQTAQNAAYAASYEVTADKIKSLQKDLQDQLADTVYDADYRISEDTHTSAAKDVNVLQATGEIITDAQKANIDALIAAIQNKGSSILFDEKYLASLGLSEEQITELQENTSALRELADKISANSDTIATIAGQRISTMADENSIVQSNLDTLGKFFAANQENWYDSSKLSGKNAANQYKDLIGAEDASKTSGKTGYYTFTMADGSTQDLHQNVIKMLVARENALKQFDETTLEEIERMYEETSEDYVNGLLAYASGDLDVNELDEEAYNKLKETFGGNLVEALNGLYLDGAAIVEKYGTQLDEWNKTYHDRIEYLGSGLGGALNSRDNLLTQKAELELDIKNGNGDVEELQKKVNAIVEQLSENADEIKLQINSSLREDVDEAFDIGREFDTLQEKIANGLEMTTDDVVSLIDSGYGELLRNCEATTEGTISLNQSVVDAYVQQKKDEVEADRQAKIAQLETQREMLVVQEKALQEKKRLLIAATQAETDTAAAGYMAQAMMQQVIADDAALQAAGVVDADTAKSQALTENAKAVAEYTTDTLNTTTLDAVNSNVAIDTSTYNLASNVVNYWNTMAKAKANYFNITEKNAKNFKDTTFDPASMNVQTGYSGSDVKGFDTSKLSDADAVAKQIEKWTSEIDKLGTLKDIQDAANSLIAGTDSELKSVGAQIGAIDAALARLRSGNLINSTVGGGSGSDTTKELKEVLERYHEITREIEYQKELLDDISTAADRAYGTDKIEMLTQKIEKLNKVAELQAQKQAAASAFVVSDLEALRAAGLDVEYDTASMELKNYTQLLEQITNEYNSRINSVSKDQQDMVQQEYDDKMQLLENYEDSIDTFREQLNAYEDAMRQIEDAKLEKVKEALQIRIDWKEMQDTLREFQKEINSSVGDALDNGFRNAGLDRQGIEDEISMFGDYETKMNSLLDMIRNANQYTDVQALQDELADLREELVDSGTAMLDYIETLKDTLPDALDAATDRFNEFIDLLENSQSVLNSINDLVDLQTINNSLAEKYAALGESYTATLENSFTQAKLQKQYMERAETQLREAELALANATQGTAEYDILKADRDALLEDYQEAQNAMLEATASAMEAAKNLYSNTLDDIFYEFESKVTKGLGFDQLEARYNRTKDEDDRFLDGVNRYVETQELNNKLQQSIAAANSDYAKATLKALEDEFAERQANNDLSEYDLKIMEAKYNLTLKQIALEEAQNAKSKVRLVRGANGNYNYLFTADGNDIATKQQEYLKAMQDYYNTAKDQTENITGEIVSLWQDMSEEIRKIYEDDTLDAEQRQNAINEIQDYYQKKYADLAKQQTDAAKDMKDAGNIALDDQQKAAQKYGDDTSETAQNFQKNFQRILEEMGGNADDFNSAYSDQLINLVAIEGSFTETTASMFAKLNEALIKYKGNIENISNEIGVSYDQLTDKINQSAQAAEELEQKATTAIDEIWNKIDELQDVTQAQAAWTAEVYNTITAIQKLAAETAQAVQKYNEAVSSINKLGATGSWSGGSSSGSGSGADIEGSGYSSGQGQESAEERELTKILQSYIGVTPDGIWGPNSQAAAKNSKGYSDRNSIYRFYISDLNVTRNPKNQEKFEVAQRLKRKIGLFAYNTGGYTGDWGSEGRLAVLHQKELVLNQEDTKNMLAAVQSIRELAPSMIAEMRSRISGASNASQALFGSRYSRQFADFNRKATELAQNVSINADFPGVRDAIEIKEALESLVQTSAQRINFYTK